MKITPWRTFFEGGPVLHQGGDFNVDDAFKRGLLHAFEHFKKAYGYYPPLVGEHPKNIPGMEESTEDFERFPEGIPYGLIHEIKEFPDGSLKFRARLTDLGKRWWNDIRHFSPSVWKKYTDPHTGQVFSPALREISAVVVPHLKNISAETRFLSELTGLSEYSQLTLAELGPATGEEKMDVEKLAEDLAALQAQVAELVAALAAMQPAENAGEEEEPSPSSDMSEAAKTHAELRKFRQEMALERAKAATEKDLGDVADEKLVQSLSEVRVKQGEEAYRHLSKAILAGKTGATQAPIGSAVAVAKTGGKMDNEKFLSMAETAFANGVKPMKLNDYLVDAKGMDLAEVLRLKSENRARVEALYNAIGGAK